jgi:hypothetical protein
MIRKMDDGAIEAVGNRRTGRASGSVFRSEHEMIHEQLRAPFEKVGQDGWAGVGFEPVFFVNANPRQCLSPLCQFVAAPGQRFLRLQQLLPGDNPLLPRYDFVWLPINSRLWFRHICAHLFLSLAPPATAVCHFWPTLIQQYDEYN